MTVLAINRHHQNRHVIIDCTILGYIKGRTLDCTYGLGNFWTDSSKPEDFTACDLNPDKSPIGYSIDFTELNAHFMKDEFDTVVFDPPYKLNGTSTGKGVSQSDASYGVDGTYTPWQDRFRQIRAGIDQCLYVLKSKGHLLLKCQDQVCSGKVRWQTFDFKVHAERDGKSELVDMLHVLNVGNQPQTGTQVHARRNYSTLMVFRKA